MHSYILIDHLFHLHSHIYMHTILLKDFPLLIIMLYLAGKLTKKRSAGKMKAEVPERVRKRLTERTNLGA